MKKLFTIIFFLALSLISYSQGNMKVLSFSKNETDMDARITFKKLDFNGDVAALIKIETTKKNFYFDAGQIGIVDTDNDKVAEVWVYIPKGAIRLKIQHQEYGVLNYEFPIEIKAATVYNLALSTSETSSQLKETINNQHFVLFIEPKDETVQLSIDNGSPIDITNGEISQYLSRGEHTYQLKSEFYHTETGVVTIGDSKVVKSITLAPNFGYININANTEANVSINNLPVGTTPYTSKKLPLGNYSVRLTAPNHTDFSENYVITKGGETINITGNLKSTLSSITLSTDMKDASIYINNELKGAGDWNGDLPQGTYEVRVSKDGHRSISKTVTVVTSQPQTIKLDSPTPIYGSLNISSSPIGAEVFIEGKSLGTSPDIFRNVLIGTHTVEIAKPGYKTVTKKVKISEAHITDLSVALTNESANTVGYTSSAKSSASTTPLSLSSSKKKKSKYTPFFKMGSLTTDSGNVLFMSFITLRYRFIEFDLLQVELYSNNDLFSLYSEGDSLYDSLMEQIEEERENSDDGEEFSSRFSYRPEIRGVLPLSKSFALTGSVGYTLSKYSNYGIGAASLRYIFWEFMCFEPTIEYRLGDKNTFGSGIAYGFSFSLVLDHSDF